MADVDELAVVARHRFEAVIGRLDEDFRLISSRAQDALNAKHLVTDRIAVPQCREDLVNPGHRRKPAATGSRAALTAAPLGSFAITSSPGGRVRRRRMNQGGSSGSDVGRAGSLVSRSKTSRYFRSMTGHS